MQHSNHRRDFLKTTGAAFAALALPRLGTSLLAAEARKEAFPNARKLGWSLCAQLYTFRRFPFYEALDMIAKLGFEHVEPCFFLPLAKDKPDLKTNEDLPPDARKELQKRLADKGVKMTNFYADFGKDVAAYRKKFDFAKEMGVQTFVSEPPLDVYDAIEKLCDEFKINLSVHHHAKGTGSLYWDPQSILDVTKGRGKRIGACCDTGHWVRSGLDPTVCLKRLEGRIITVHLKDVEEWGKPESRDVPLGTGKANYVAVLAELYRQKFQGVAAVEYEHDSEKLLDDVAACTRFVEEAAGKLTR
jgi:sugar phosphate isomerase/epimerase